MQQSKGPEAFFSEPLYEYTEESNGMMRQVSKGVKSFIDRVKPNMQVRVNREYYEALPGDNTQKTTAILASLTELSARVKITTLEMPHMHLSGGEQPLADVVRAHRATLTRVDFDNNDFYSQMPAVLGAALAQCSSLARVSMSSCGIVESVAADLMHSLSSCTQLTHLNLANNTMRLAGAQGVADALARFPLLSLLDLSSNAIGDEGTGLLAAALPRCTALSILRLCTNSIRPTGCISLASALPACAGLAELDLHNNFIGNEGCEALIRMYKARPNPRMTVDVRRNGVGVEQMVAARAAGIVSYEVARVHAPPAPHVAGPATWGATGQTDAVCAGDEGLYRVHAELCAMRRLLCHDA